MAERANKIVRAALGMRLRALRKARGLSQERVGLSSRPTLSGKFIGEVERGEKSISVDSLVLVASVLDIEPCELLDFSINGSPSKAGEDLLAFVQTNRARLVRTNALDVLRVLAAKPRR